MAETEVVVWITLGQYAADHIQDASALPEGSAFEITWSGQRHDIKKCRDDWVNTGAIVLFRHKSNTPFCYLGRLSEDPEVITPRNVELQQTGIYRLTIRKDDMFMRVFNKADTDIGTGCYKRAALFQMGLENGEFLQGIGRYRRM